MLNQLTEDQQAEKEKYLRRFIAENIIRDRFINIGRITKVPKIIGFIGPWGSGKSLSGGAMTIVDFLIPEYNVWSNMDITYAVKVGNNIVTYRSMNLERADMTHLQLSNGMLFIDEINIEYAEARRSTSRYNVGFSKVIQMLRKRALSLIYTVIDEMWVDHRLRELTSVFIKCRDVCLKPGGLSLPFDFGSYIEWTGYDMVGILGGGAYADTHQPAFHTTLYAKPFHGSYDTFKVQGEEIEYYGEEKQPRINAETQTIVAENPELNKYVNIMQTVTDVINDYIDSGVERVEGIELFDTLGSRNPNIDVMDDSIRKFITHELRKQIPFRYSGGKQLYELGRLYSLREKSVRA